MTLPAERCSSSKSLPLSPGGSSWPLKGLSAQDAVRDHDDCAAAASGHVRVQQPAEGGDRTAVDLTQGLASVFSPVWVLVPALKAPWKVFPDLLQGEPGPVPRAHCREAAIDLDRPVAARPPRDALGRHAATMCWAAGHMRRPPNQIPRRARGGAARPPPPHVAPDRRALSLEGV
eukprot:CAMPEP_0175285820 /NCGR_PEP_ID=MMETSP0093-20121207/53441_1 /TAXON_ID=311494 /ORGANISM="Alexandrium monilatum, Strain CCMP3105" /LENGTH=174 /DNA_ID=CAMNT_0016581259 /DNA_START=78 /DNA_END=602 /DNA_ORIENTATION=-